MIDSRRFIKTHQQGYIMKFTPSPMQVAIFKAIRDTQDSLIIEAVAGSGKTTTIVAAVKIIPENLRTMFLAFNKSIATELSEKLPEHVNCMTLNSLGYRAWMKYIGGRADVKTNKITNILKQPQFKTEYGEWKVRQLLYPVNQLIGFAKQAGLVPKDAQSYVKTSLVDDTDAAWKHIINYHNVDFNVKRDGKSLGEYRRELAETTDMAIKMARQALTLSIRKKNEVDFNDQLFMPVVYGAEFAKHDVIFLDEAQDISHIQRVMVKRALVDGGRVIAVGDRHQAIYGFRGADSSSLDNIKRMFNCVVLPLSVSYRCGVDIIELAQNIVPHIEARDGAQQGKIEYLTPYSETYLPFKPHDYIICRNVAPLVTLAFTIIRSGKPAYIVGDDIGKTISKLITKLKPTGINNLRQRLYEWEKAEIQRLQEADPMAVGSWISDRADTVRAFIDSSGANTVEELLRTIEELFENNADNAIKLSTIHKSKGLESDRVFILDQKLMPSKYATHDWQKEQEDNLKYVAITRAINYLGFIDSPEKERT